MVDFRSRTGQRYSGLGLVLAMFAACFISWSCYPEAKITSVEELDVVLTLFDRETNFRSFMTYGMPDTVIHLGDSEISREFDNLIISTIALNMSALGYTRVSDEELEQNGADVLVLVSATTTDWTGVVSYSWWDSWGYWCPWGYWGGWGPGWGYGYPYGGSAAYEYTTASLIMEIFDPNRRDVQREILPGVWTGVLNGVVTGLTAGTTTRLTSGINQAFKQSSYLSTR